MRSLLHLRPLAFAVALLAAGPAEAVNLVIDYTYDTQNFFGAGNPDGAVAGTQARERLEEAADFFSAILGDSLDPIVTPDPYTSDVFDGVVTWSWRQRFTHPGTGLLTEIMGSPIAEDEYRVYAGGSSIGVLGVGGPGAWNYLPESSGGFTASENNEVNAINNDFFQLVSRRNAPAGDFETWGGSITFDNDGSTDWHYGADDDLGSGQSDFLTVAIHELGHALGFGTAPEFTAQRAGNLFVGPESVAAYGNPPPLDPGTGHWQEGLRSVIYGTSTAQDVLMDPTLRNGQRTLLTELDAAGLDDIGWELLAPPPTGLPGDYNDDGRVDAIDYVVWRDARDGGGPSVGTWVEWSTNYGATAPTTSVSIPEPAAWALLLAGASVACRLR